jgi:hypothetical protein
MLSNELWTSRSSVVIEQAQFPEFFRSEQVAAFRSDYPADFIGIRTLEQAVPKVRPAVGDLAPGTGPSSFGHPAPSTSLAATDPCARNRPQAAHYYRKVIDVPEFADTFRKLVDRLPPAAT